MLDSTITMGDIINLAFVLIAILTLFGQGRKERDERKYQEGVQKTLNEIASKERLDTKNALKAHIEKDDKRDEKMNIVVTDVGIIKNHLGITD